MKYALLILVLFFTVKSYSQDTAASKSGYHLFHPTPEIQMRDFIPDRPGFTEVPNTLDAGHLQFDTDLFSTERTNIGGVKTIRNFYNTAYYKLGITNSFDLQFGINTFSTSVIKTTVNTIKQSIYGGDLTIKARQNIWGNDGGKTAFAILPFVNIPVKSSDKISGGIAFPLGISLSNEWDLCTQIRTDLVYNENSKNHQMDFMVSVLTSHSITNNFDFFMEGAALRNNDKTYEYFFNGGLMCRLAKNINIDGGVYYGIKNISSKTYFVGASFRI